MTTKTCFKCLIEWPLHYFYKHKQMKDGHLNKCKKCAKKDSTDRRNKNLQYVLEYDRYRYKNDMKRRQDHNNSTKKHRQKYPEKYKARMILGNAVRDGRLIKYPCCVCGNIKSTAHHEDYSKPLEVVWVCLLHHKQLE
jgi:hypothetical protein